MKAFVNRGWCARDKREYYDEEITPELFKKLDVDIIITQEEDSWEGGADLGTIIISSGEVYEYEGDLDGNEIAELAKKCDNIDELIEHASRKDSPKKDIFFTAYIKKIGKRW